MKIDFFEQMCYNLVTNGGYDMKYKFRLSYKAGNKYIPINLNNVVFLSDISKTEIKAIDEFTTYFETKEDMLNYLKSNNLIPNNVDTLYITFDVKQDNKTYEQLYAYNKTLFFKGDIDRLKYSYIYKYFRNNFENGAFMENIVEHYEKKYVHKNFTTLKVLARAIKDGGIWSLDNDDRKVYYEEFDKFLDFLFKKTTKKGTKVNYKNVRDFLCFIDGEEPIKVKGNEIFETIDPKVVKPEEIMDDFIEPENIPIEEYCKYNRDFIPEYFEAYQDGNDFIAPITKEEMEESLNDYAKKLCFKRDNGEYE